MIIALVAFFTFLFMEFVAWFAHKYVMHGFLWNLHETPNDEYRYTPFSLERHLIESGFHDINIKATGGWHSAMGQMLGLWVKRSSMKPYKRKLLKVILKPIIKYLIRIQFSIQFNHLSLLNFQ